MRILQFRSDLRIAVSATRYNMQNLTRTEAKTKNSICFLNKSNMQQKISSLTKHGTTLNTVTISNDNNFLILLF